MVRRATRAEVDPIAAMLTRAFEDDPVMRWLFPDAPRMRGFFSSRARGLVRQDEVWTTDDLAGAALWAEPGRWRLGPLETVALAVRFLFAFGRRLPAVMEGLERVENAHPDPPHYYLAVLGTEPSRQGEGIGSALLEPVLEICDEDEIGAYLESSKERNIDYYARFGFRVIGEVEMPGGPCVWPMWRDPR
ncbi:MAG TPA: GNAT family N-acetyltransferase [Thermoleophilaceae bacterium]|nr:GNAT family N-acetyltransferase [Thermoleophilaceae bacterium]